MKILQNNLKMGPRLLFLPVISGLILLSIYFFGCQQTTQSSFSGSIQGWVYDTTNRSPLLNVMVTRIDNNSSAFTNDSGRFWFMNIDMPRSDYELFLKFEKSGFKTDTHKYVIKSDAIKNVDSIFMHRDTL